MIRTFAKWLGMLLYVPFIVLLLPFIALGVGIIFTNATISGLFQRARWLRDLRRNGRARPAAEMLDTATSGTLIVDRPGFNFRATQCWWTNEDVRELSPVPVPTDDDRIELCKQTKETTVHEFDLWCWERYISPDTGSAILVTPPHHGETMAAKIRERQPGLERVMSWSAIPAMRSLNHHATEQTDEREPG
jgi:hypothetical protein